MIRYTSLSQNKPLTMLPKTASATRIHSGLKCTMRAETHRRFEILASDMHQGFEQVNRELGENRERMAKLEGSLDGFLAGRRDRDAA